MRSLLRDIRFGARSLRQTPGFLIVAVLALAMGIGLTTTMFSIVYGALLNGLPVPDGRSVVAVERTNRLTSDRGTQHPAHDYADIRAQQRSFSAMGAYSSGTVNVSGTDRAERFNGGFMTPGAFQTLQVAPLLGRTFREEEAAQGAEPVVVLGYEVWQNRFGGSPDVIGTTLRANGVVHTVVGVMPEGFLFPDNQQIWLPLAIDPLPSERGAGQWVTVIGRLAPGVSMDAASIDIGAIFARIAAEHPTVSENVTAQVGPFIKTSIGDEAPQILYTMLGAVSLVLLIACMNVANLLLGRAAHRAREVGIRTALGASRWAIMRQFLLEAFVLAAAASVVGTIIAYVGVGLFNRAIVDTNPPYWLDIALHPWVLGFTAMLALLSTLLAGILPAVQASRPNLQDVLKDEARGSSGLRVGKASRVLVTFEVALSCGLLVAAGLMVKSVVKLRTIDHGFRTESIFTARLGFPSTFTDTVAQRRFFEQLEGELATLPGAQSVTLASGLPGTGSWRGPVAIDGRTYEKDSEMPRAASIVVTPGFFPVFDLPARSGRLLEPGDRGETAPVAVVNEAFVREHLAGESPLGRTVRVGGARDTTGRWMTIVGVVPDIHSGNAETPLPAMVFQPLSQNHRRFVSIAVSTQGAPMSLTGSVRDLVARLDQDIAIYWARTMTESLGQQNWHYRVFGGLFMIFGAVALFLAAVGLYAVMAFAVNRRTRELGIRMALGAKGRDVVRLILGQGAWQVGIGMILGLGIALGLGQLMQNMLFDVQPRDPLIFAAVVTLLAGAGLLACLIPALRATQVDPLAALRTD